MTHILMKCTPTCDSIRYPLLIGNSQNTATGSTYVDMIAIDSSEKVAIGGYSYDTTFVTMSN